MARETDSQASTTWPVAVASAAVTMAVLVTAATALGWLRPPEPTQRAAPREATTPTSPNPGHAADPPGSEIVLVPVAPTASPSAVEPAPPEGDPAADELLVAEWDEGRERSWDDDEGEHHREHHGHHEEHDDDD